LHELFAYTLISECDQDVLLLHLLGLRVHHSQCEQSLCWRGRRRIVVLIDHS
jgi:hypothetical protein